MQNEEVDLFSKLSLIRGYPSLIAYLLFKHSCGVVCMCVCVRVCVCVCVCGERERERRERCTRHFKNALNREH